MRNFDLRELQKLEYRMLKDVTDLCDENGIVYFLDAGTLLGAVRHQGFIPWDDDIDICMDLKNYKKFIKIAPKKLAEKYFFQNYRTDPKLGIKWSRVRINNTTSMERNMTNYDIHYGVCMDIFVKIGLAESRIGQWVQYQASVWMSTLLEKYVCEASRIETSSKIKLLYKILPESVRLVLIRILERILSINTEKRKYCYNTWFMNPFDKNTVKIPSEYYAPSKRIKLKFEEDMFWVPEEYENCLELNYGDWKKLPPLEERGGHGDIIVDLENSYKKYYTGK